MEKNLKKQKTGRRKELPVCVDMCQKSYCEPTARSTKLIICTQQLKKRRW